MRETTWLFWDFDNTLAKRETMWGGLVHELLLRRGINSIPYPELRPFLNLGFPWDSPETPHALFLKGRDWWTAINAHIAESLVRLGLEPGAAREVASGVRAEFLRPGAWRLFPDAAAALAKAREKGFANAILSNHVPELPELVERLGLAGYFREIIGSARAGCEKPSREIFAHAEALSPDASRRVMIGDSYGADVAGALRAGWEAILVHGDNPKAYPRHNPDLLGVFSLLERAGGR